MKNLCLENLKVGDEVVSIHKKNGKIIYGEIRFILNFSENHNRYRYARIVGGSTCGSFPLDGGCRNFMSKNPNPDFYMSANPKHIAAAKKQHERARVKAQRENEKTKAKLEKFKQELEKLKEKYGASIYAVQTNGDDHGVEIEIHLSIGNQCCYFDS